MAAPTSGPIAAVGIDLIDLLARIRMGDRAIHDIRLRFTVAGIHRVVPTEICKNNPTNGDLALPPIDIGMRHGRIIVHATDTVSVMLGCSLDPFPLTIAGYGELASFLGVLRIRLLDSCKPVVLRVPDVTSWVAVHWHFGRDGRNEVAGPRFSVTVGGLGEGLLRAYTKKLAGRQTLRIEKGEVPMKGLAEAFSEKLESPNDSQEKEFEMEQDGAKGCDMVR